MPGLIRGVARTAAVVGTAGAVNHHQQKKWAAKDQQAAQAAAYQEQQYAPPPPQYAEPQYAPAPQYAPPPPPPAAEVDPTVEKINQLADLHCAGDPQRRGVRRGQGQGTGHLGPQHVGWRSSRGATRFTTATVRWRRSTTVARDGGSPIPG